MRDVWGRELDLCPFSDKIHEGLRFDSGTGDIPDVMAHEFKCPLGDPSHGVTITDDVFKWVRIDD